MRATSSIHLFRRVHSKEGGSEHLALLVRERKCIRLHWIEARAFERSLASRSRYVTRVLTQLWPHGSLARIRVNFATAAEAEASLSLSPFAQVSSTSFPPSVLFSCSSFLLSALFPFLSSLSPSLSPAGRTKTARPVHKYTVNGKATSPRFSPVTAKETWQTTQVEKRGERGERCIGEAGFNAPRTPREKQGGAKVFFHQPNCFGHLLIVQVARSGEWTMHLLLDQRGVGKRKKKANHLTHQCRRANAHLIFILPWHLPVETRLL